MDDVTTIEHVDIVNDVYTSLDVACREAQISYLALLELLLCHSVRVAVRTEKLRGIIAYGKRRGVALATYEGLCRLKHGQLRMLLKDEVVDADWFRPLQHKFLTIKSYNNPYENSLPNNLLDTWLDLQGESIPAYDFIFYPEPVRKPTATPFMKNLMSGNMSGIGDLSSILKELQESFVMFPSTHRFTLQNVRVCLRDVMARKIVLTQTEPNKKLARPLDALLLKIIQEQPSLSASKIWALLSEDQQKTDRVYDVDEIIEDVGVKELAWTDIDGKDNYLTKNSFYNLVKKLKEKFLVNSSANSKPNLPLETESSAED